MHDASLGGYGITSGRYDERSRFSKAYDQGLPPRAHALLALDPSRT